MEIEIRRATVLDAEALGKLMKEDDANEVFAAAGLGPVAGLVRCLNGSETAAVALLDGVPFAMFGVGRVPDGGMPWLLGSSGINRAARRFLRESRLVVAAMKDRYGYLYNYVDARHVVSIRWLGWLGFEILPAAPYGFSGLPFHRFEMR